MAEKPAKPAAKSDAKPTEKAAARPAEPPKPVHIGGESFVDRILPHIKKIVIGILIGAAVLVVIFTIRWFQERGEIGATEKVERVLDVAQRPLREPGATADPKKPSFADTKERAAAVLDALAKQGTDAAGHAFRGAQLLDAGKVDEAITEYRAGAAVKEAGKEIEGVLCREGLGIALETKAAADKDAAVRQKGFEEALAAFVTMQPSETGPRRAYALYHQARLQLLLGKRTEAKALFEKAKLANKDDREISNLIENRLAALGDS